MKKSFLALTALAISLYGCASKAENNTMNDSNTTQTATQPAATPAPDTQSQEMKDAMVAIEAAKHPDAPVTPPTPGKHGDTVTTASGLQYIDLKKGTGAMPTKGQTITVNYTGKLTNGKTFDSNVDPDFHHVSPFSTKIGVGQVIKGWDEGMLTMKVGGKRRLICPPNLAYGPQGRPPTIPANSTLIFDVELLKVQ
jgi:peptidylprolyl isomerase